LEKEAAAKHKEKRRRNKTKQNKRTPTTANQTVCEKQREPTKRRAENNPKTTSQVYAAKINYYFRQNKNSQKPNK